MLKGQSELTLDDIIDEIGILAGELPRSVRRTFYDLFPGEKFAAIRVSGAPFRDVSHIPTPRPSYSSRDQMVSFNDVVHLLLTFLLGQPITFASIQSGRLISDVSPDPDAASEARSSGYNSTFDFHSDDAFSDLAGDILALRCFRNDESVPTLVSVCDDLNLHESWADPLFEPKFKIWPNVAHSVEPGSIPRRSVLYGHRHSPYIRINLNKVACDPDDGATYLAYQALVQRIREMAREVLLKAGDCLYIDNFRAVHAREKYSPSKVGFGRWYRRIYATASFRNSRRMRAAPLARVIEGGG